MEDKLTFFLNHCCSQSSNFILIMKRNDSYGGIIIHISKKSCILVQGSKINSKKKNLEKQKSIDETEKGPRRSFPKGHLEDGENDISCAIREIYEECGLNRDQYDILQRIDGGIYVNPTRSIFFFLITVKQSHENDSDVLNLKPTASDIAEAVWVPIDQLYDETQSRLKASMLEFFDSNCKKLVDNIITMK